MGNCEIHLNEFDQSPTNVPL